MDFLIRDVDERWFSESVPCNYKEAYTVIGSGTNGEVTITQTDIVDSDKKINIVLASSASQPLTAEIVASGLKITLGTTEDETPTADDNKNTAELIAESINALEGYSAVYSGTGETSISDAVSDQAFTDGQYGTPCPMAGLAILSSGTYYVCIKADMSCFNTSWRSFTLTNY